MLQAQPLSSRAWVATWSSSSPETKPYRLNLWGNPRSFASASRGTPCVACSPDSKPSSFPVSISRLNPPSVRSCTGTASPDRGCLQNHTTAQFRSFETWGEIPHTCYNIVPTFMGVWHCYMGNFSVCPSSPHLKGDKFYSAEVGASARSPLVTFFCHSLIDIAMLVYPARIGLFTMIVIAWHKRSRKAK